MQPGNPASFHFNSLETNKSATLGLFRKALNVKDVKPMHVAIIRCVAISVMATSHLAIAEIDAAFIYIANRICDFVWGH